MQVGDKLAVDHVTVDGAPRVSMFGNLQTYYVLPREHQKGIWRRVPGMAVAPTRIFPTTRKGPNTRTNESLAVAAVTSDCSLQLFLFMRSRPFGSFTTDISGIRSKILCLRYTHPQTSRIFNRVSNELFELFSACGRADYFDHVYT